MEREKLSAAKIAENLGELKTWALIEEKDVITKRFNFENFAQSLEFVNKAGEIAERLDHHPDITFGWGYAEFQITTHDRNGLTDFDFALAKEIDNLVEN